MVGKQLLRSEEISEKLDAISATLLTQELGSVGTVELDGCARDLLGALHVTIGSQSERPQASDSRQIAEVREVCQNQYRTSVLALLDRNSKLKLALPWTGTADLMLAPRKV